MNKLKRKILLYCTILFGCQSCSYFFDEDEKEPIANESSESESKNEEQTGLTNSKKKSQNQIIDEKELKVARLWSRVDELEENQRKMKEKLKLLEKGLLLGIMPEEINDDSFSTHSKETLVGSQKHETYGKDNKSPLESKQVKTDIKSGPPLSVQEEKAYQEALAIAHEHFRAGRYGRAIVEFDALGKKWGHRVPGAVYLYWIGKSWIELKEYQSALKSFTELTSQHAQSPWIPRAKLEIARLEWRLGKNETALSRYREIIRDYPFEDAAEMAKMELSQVDKTL